QFNQFNTINWYQQTWHTIEFSNNRHTRHHHNTKPWIAPEQLFKLTRWSHSCQTGVRDLHQPEAFVSIFPSDSVEQRGNKLYHQFAGMTNQAPDSLLHPRPAGSEKPGISRNSELFAAHLREPVHTK
ncbi:MAG TPA: hypothetical protein VIM40_07230, partial [Arthrobacter sp.]